MFLRLLLASVLLLPLAACDSDTRRFTIEAAPPAKEEVRLRARVGKVLVRTVSLPTYAASEEVAFEDATGVIKLSKSDFWADEPERATTLVISRLLNQMTTATVAPQPWPLEETPQAAVDIRVEQLLATNRATLRLSGQYFIGGAEIEPDFDAEDVPKSPRYTIRSKARLFDIHVPLASTETAAFAAAQSQALRVLAEKIARDLSR